MKTIKAFMKLLNGFPLEPKEQRKVDAVILDVKAAVVTAIIVLLFIGLLYSFGVFNA